MIKDAEFYCSIGITAEERAHKQKILVDITMFRDTVDAAKTDAIDSTVNYSSVYKQIQELLECKQYNLIETAADQISKLISRYFGLTKIIVCVKKPQAIKKALYAAVEVERA